MRHIVISLGLSVVGACSAYPAGQLPPPDDTVSVQYSPYGFEMAELQRAADAQCDAKGYPRAVPLDDQPNTKSVRWSYLTFGCYRR